MRKIDISEAVGGGYSDFWKFRGRYRIVKGSRASKKSRTAALWFIYNLRRYPLANLLVVRKTYSSLERSCFTELKWAAERLGVSGEFIFKTSPLEITRKKTGQKIIFKGLDDPMKLTSITVGNGVLCWLWCEEAFEISDEGDFDMIDELIRGRMPRGYFKQITLTLNPWNENHWIKKRFFDVDDDDILAITTTYKTNEFLDVADIKMFEKMRLERPERYRVAGLGEWGAVSGLIFPNFEIRDYDPEVISLRGRYIFGLDFGYTNDPTALFCGIFVREEESIYVFDEVYEKGLTNDRIAKIIKMKGFEKERIVADCAEPKSIDELRNLGIKKIIPSQKGNGSILHGIDYIQRNRIIILPCCKNFIAEIGNYVWEVEADGSCTNRPRGKDDHLMDAMRYAVSGCYGKENFSFY